MKGKVMRKFQPKNFIMQIGLAVLLLLALEVIIMYGLKVDLGISLITMGFILITALVIAIFSYFGLGFHSGR